MSWPEKSHALFHKSRCVNLPDPIQNTIPSSGRVPMPNSITEKLNAFPIQLGILMLCYKLLP